jgi:hypothetical protein
VSITTTAPAGDVYAERWRLWQLAYTESSRKSAMQVRVVFTVVVTALAVAFGLQLLYA